MDTDHVVIDTVLGGWWEEQSWLACASSAWRYRPLTYHTAVVSGCLSDHRLEPAVDRTPASAAQSTTHTTFKHTSVTRSPAVTQFHSYWYWCCALCCITWILILISLHFMMLPFIIIFWQNSVLSRTLYIELHCHGCQWLTLCSCYSCRVSIWFQPTTKYIYCILETAVKCWRWIHVFHVHRVVTDIIQT